MADLGYCKRLLAGISNEKDRVILGQVIEHILGNLRFGVPDHQTRAVNFQAYFERSTTAAATGSEFSIEHGLPAAPRYAISVLPLDTPGAKSGFLSVSRAADARRIYLTTDAGSTNVAFALLVE